MNDNQQIFTHKIPLVILSGLRGRACPLSGFDGGLLIAVFKLHSLRYGFAALLVGHGADNLVVSKLLDHSGIKNHDDFHE